MKSVRVWLAPQDLADSYIRVVVDPDDGNVNMKLADCDRRIWWYFGRPGDKRAKAKIAKIKKVVDAVYEYLHSA